MRMMSIASNPPIFFPKETFHTIFLESLTDKRIDLSDQNHTIIREEVVMEVPMDESQRNHLVLVVGHLRIKV